MPLPTTLPVDAHAIVATYRTSDTLQVFDPTRGLVNVPNPDWHPDINVTVSGKLVYGDGSEVRAADVPAYIADAVVAQRNAVAPGPAPQQKLTLAEAMLGAGVDRRTGAVLDTATPASGPIDAPASKKPRRK